MLDYGSFFASRPSSSYRRKILYILELTLGFETNIQNNNDRKAAKYSSLINDLSLSYSKVVFVNPSVGAIGVMGYIQFSFILTTRVTF